MADFSSGQEEANPEFWLAIRVQGSLFPPLGPQEKYNKSVIDQAWRVREYFALHVLHAS